MTLDINITENDNNQVIITEITDGNQYLPEGSTLTAKNRFLYEDTASVDVFRLNATTGTKLSTTVIMLRKEDEEVSIKLNIDGWFTAMHMVIPSEDWVNKELSKEGSILNTYDIVWYTDGKQIYNRVGTTVTRATIEELLAETSDNTTISRVDKDYVSITLLQEKCDSAYVELFKNRMYNGGCGQDDCEASRLVAAINLIKHYVRWGQLAEAERIIEKSNYFSNTKKSKDVIYKPKPCCCG